MGLFNKVLSTATLGLVGGKSNNILSDTGTQQQQQQVNVSGSSQLENQFSQRESDLYSQLGNDIQNLPSARNTGISEGQNIYDLAQQLKQLSGQEFSGTLSEQDINIGKQLADAFTAEEAASLGTNYETQVAEANRLATRLGRSTVDPILQAQLRKTVLNQQQQLSAKKTGLASQYALNNLSQRIGARQNQADLFSSALGAQLQSGQYQSGLQSQQYNQSLQSLQSKFNQATMASNIVGREQNFRLGAAGRTVNSSSTAGFLDTLGAVAGIAGSAKKLGV